MEQPMRLFPISILTAVLTGCTLPVTITDHTTSPVSGKSVSEFIGVERAQRLAIQPTDDFIHVRLTTKESLVDLARRKSLIIDPKVKFCDSNRGKYHLNIVGLTQNGEDVHDWAFPHHDEKFQVVPAENEYDLLIFASLEENTFAQQYNPIFDHAGHDLYTDPRDICFTIGGGLYAIVLVSNEVRISKSEIQKMLDPH